MKTRSIVCVLSVMLVFGTNQKDCQATKNTVTNTGTKNIAVYAGDTQSSALQTILPPGMSVWLSKSYPVIFGVGEDGSLDCYYRSDQ